MTTATEKEEKDTKDAKRGETPPPVEFNGTNKDDHKQLLADLAYATHVTDSPDWDDYGDGADLALKIYALMQVRRRHTPLTPEEPVVNPTATHK